MKLTEYVCKRCGWRWFPRKEKVKQCPGCRTKLWNKERQVKNGKTFKAVSPVTASKGKN